MISVCARRRRRLKRLPTEQPILSILSVGYLVTFVALGFASDLGQTIFYAVLMVVAFALVAVTYTHFRLRPLTLWGLSFWGVAHMAGGLLSVGGDVLYHSTSFSACCASIRSCTRSGSASLRPLVGTCSAR